MYLTRAVSSALEDALRLTAGLKAQGVDSGGRKNGQNRQDYYFFGSLLTSSRCAPSARFQHIRAYMPVSSKTSIVDV
ncbi:hypothetical protein EVAR_67167_1 [Eumeta japonica]|uniref:Uncharacterized protein n=1 Tax=Eumeta variegata TaxID=151549 RepID=A0A4C1ZY66_EUMVA|nr:hypothetical protein EVAR_67167_1 [Eumeta japonica]